MKKKAEPSIEYFLAQMARGCARLQARQEMLECIIARLIQDSDETTRARIAASLRTSQSDFETRSREARDYTPPDVDADALALLNVLLHRCAGGENAAGHPT